MRIREIRHKELQGYIDSKEYQESKYIPISQHRAVSHIHNPRAEAEDLVLVLVYDDTEEMVGYLGVFPDELHFRVGIERAGWLSCMWVNPKMRGKGIAKKLINTVFKAWDYRILVTEFTPAAKGLYDRTEQFLELAKPKGVRGYLQLNLSYLLPKKDLKWEKWSPLLAMFDGIFNFFNSIRLLGFSPKPPRFSYVESIDNEAMQFIQQFKSQELMNRQATDLAWMVRYPWLISAPIPDYNAQRYHFSAVDRRFNFLNIKVFDKKNQLIAFLILTVRGDNLKVPYAYFNALHSDTVMQVIYQHMIDMDLDMVTVFHPKLVEHLKANKSPFFLKRDFQRHYIISKVFEEQLAATPTFDIQDGDADAAFT
ncbi:MAG: GNAT family N-acetyltransferase [Aureispira sp.]|nr:GNAT family N-acetyltransferase [Aureispira sp.]